MIHKTGQYYCSLNLWIQLGKEHPPSDTMTASPLLAASVLAISLSSPVEPLPHHTYATWGVTTTKQSLELRQPARRSTWRREEENEWKSMCKWKKKIWSMRECEWVSECKWRGVRGRFELLCGFINYFTFHSQGSSSNSNNYHTSTALVLLLLVPLTCSMYDDLRPWSRAPEPKIWRKREREKGRQQIIFHKDSQDVQTSFGYEPGLNTHNIILPYKHTHTKFFHKHIDSKICKKKWKIKMGHTVSLNEFCGINLIR